MKQTFLFLLALITFAVAQPLFATLSESPEFLVVRRATLSEIVTLGFILTAGIASLLWCARWFLFLITRRTFLVEVLDFLMTGIFTTAWLLLTWQNLLFGILFGFSFSALVTLFSPLKRFIAFLGFAAPIPLVSLLISTLPYLEGGRSPKESRRVEMKSTQAKPTFLIIFDEFPLFVLLRSGDKLNEARFPNFSTLASKTTWFRNVSAITSWTERAVPAVLAGKVPNPLRKEIPHYRDYPENVFTLFSESHKVFGFEQITNLCAPSVCPPNEKTGTFLQREKVLLEDLAVVYLHKIAPKEYKPLLPSIEGKWGNFLVRDEKQPRKKNRKGLNLKEKREDDVKHFRDFLMKIREEVPLLLKSGVSPAYVLHVTFPHVPYRYLPDGRKYTLGIAGDNDREFVTRWPEESENQSVVALERLIMQAGMADKLIGEFLEALRALEILDTSVVAVTADHGSSFEAGEFSRMASEKNFSDILSVPLFISMPGNNARPQGSISDENVSVVDILPTLLELNGIPNDLRGRSLVRPLEAPPQEKTFMNLNGDTRILSFPATLDRSRSVRRMATYFGEGGFDDRFYNLAVSHSDLLGKSRDDVLSSVETSIPVVLHNWAGPKTIDLRKEYLPVLLKGYARLSEEAHRPVFIAIEINQIIQTVVQAERVNDRTGQKMSFSAILSPLALKQGENSVSAFVVKER